MISPTKPTVTQEAEDLVGGERRIQYGPAHVNFQRIADMWSAYLAHPITMNDVALMMTLLKIARQAEDPNMKRDNIVDSIGYLRLIEIIKEELAGERL